MTAAMWRRNPPRPGVKTPPTIRWRRTAVAPGFLARLDSGSGSESLSIFRKRVRLRRTIIAVTSR